MIDNVNKTIHFLKNLFDSSEYFTKNTAEKEYRFNHTLRVANIGQTIAKCEKLNVEAMLLGCILHDVSYKNEFQSIDDWINHGRDSAEIAREFLSSLDLEPIVINDICFGIAIHVDDKADFKGERTALACSISDCDNIDRFDVYRIYERLQNDKFSILTLNEQRVYIRNNLEKLQKQIDMPLATQTAKNMWIEKIAFQQTFFDRLEKQLEGGEKLNLVV